MLGVGRDCVCCVLGGEQVEVYILQQSDRFLLWLSKQYKKMPEIVEAETLAEQFIALGLDKSIEVVTQCIFILVSIPAKCTLCNNRRKNKKINSYPIETEAKCFVISCRVHYT